MAVTDGFVDAIVAAPLGVTLLAAIDSRARGRPEWNLAGETSTSAVAAAVEHVGSMSFGDLLALAVHTGRLHAGPWMSQAPSTVAVAYRHAAARRPIAEALSERFGDALHAPIDRAAQQWWTDAALPAWVDRIAPLFREFEHVYGAGQFTWAGLKTTTRPPVEVEWDLASAWELDRGPITRWDLAARADARVLDLHRPTDWARLVVEHPRDGLPHPEWELPGINQHPRDLAELLAVPGQRAARTSIRRHLVPDWRAVAQRYDGIHLSWAGFITTEGCITDLANGDVAMLRYWFSERTLWLADVFGGPRPAGEVVIDETPTDAAVLGARHHEDQRCLQRLFAR
ncbi:MAG: hypothetical protein JWM34_1766 [Ilumatobacteraceae bacterium]|nr:hypothetical protein [Ilumatobacteraceae bacterium]